MIGQEPNALQPHRSFDAKYVYNRLYKEAVKEREHIAEEMRFYNETWPSLLFEREIERDF